MTTPFVTRAQLTDDLRELGLQSGDAVLAHGALSKVGRMLNGPDIVVGALLDAVSPSGTVLAYTDWDARYDELLTPSGRVPAHWRPHVPPFERRSSRASRENGALAEFLRTWPNASRSGNPGASIAAVGSEADWFTADHSLDYGYGPGSPLGKLVQAGGKVAMIGAPWDTVTLLHHAEHLADLPGKRVVRYEVPIVEDGHTAWAMIEEFDTSRPVVEGLPEDYFADIVREFVDAGNGNGSPVGSADSLLLDAVEITDFAVSWLEREADSRPEIVSAAAHQNQAI